MCGRYALHASPQVVALQFGLESIAEFQASWNICPSAEVLIVRPDREGKRVASRCTWALGGKLANARAETVADKPAFRAAFLQRRCLVPASGFYEWQDLAGHKQPWYIRPADAPLFALAGIVALRKAAGGTSRSLSLITTQPNALMRPIHERMPVIVQPEDYGAWLDRASTDAGRLEKVLRPYPEGRMRAHPVSPRVNAPRNDDAALIEPV